MQRTFCANYKRTDSLWGLYKYFLSNSVHCVSVDAHMAGLAWYMWMSENNKGVTFGNQTKTLLTTEPF